MLRFRILTALALFSLGLGLLTLTQAVFASQTKKATKTQAKSAPAPAASVNTAAGKKVYAANGCATCHSIGGGGGGPRQGLTRLGMNAGPTPKLVYEPIQNTTQQKPGTP